MNHPSWGGTSPSFKSYMEGNIKGKKSVMKNKLIIISWLFLLSCQPSYDKTEDEIELWLKEIYINQYEDDSLNRSRGYLIPRIIMFLAMTILR